MERLIVEGRVEGRRSPKRWVDQDQNTWWAIICRMRYTWHRIELPGKRQSRELSRCHQALSMTKDCGAIWN